MGGLICVRMFFPNPLVIEFFYHTACSIIHYEKYLFLVIDFLGGKAFPGITHITPLPRLKSRMVGHRD